MTDTGYLRRFPNHTGYLRPIPEPTPDSKPYWDGLRAGRFLVQTLHGVR